MEISGKRLSFKATVQKHKEGGKFKNCLAICKFTDGIMGKGSREQSVSLGPLVSQLSKEPAWRRGKVISSVPLSPYGSRAQQQQQHQLLLLQPPHLHSLLGDDLKSNLSFLKRMDFGIVMDLEKIFDLILQVAVKEDLKLEQMIKKLFVFTYCIPSRLYDSCARVTLLGGWSNNLVKSFLDNGGDFRPHHLMEAAIADKEYQTLAVVD
ncbi:hypothetical protein CerSpe_175430 [Prunus speciosa]